MLGHELGPAFLFSQLDHAPDSFGIARKCFEIHNDRVLDGEIDCAAGKETNEPASHQIFHLVYGMCSQGQTWSDRGTCMCPSRESVYTKR